jgi:hypothetical protein
MDRIQGSKIHHLKELRPGSAARSEIRVLVALDPTRSALLLPGGNKAELAAAVQGKHPDRRAGVPGLHHRRKGVARHD